MVCDFGSEQNKLRMNFRWFLFSWSFFIWRLLIPSAAVYNTTLNLRLILFVNTIFLKSFFFVGSVWVLVEVEAFIATRIVWIVTLNGFFCMFVCVSFWILFYFMFGFHIECVWLHTCTHRKIKSLFFLSFSLSLCFFPFPSGTHYVFFCPIERFFAL